MAEAALSTEICKIRQVHIECTICLTRFTDPKFLICLHSFCLKCLQDLVDNIPKTGIIICPLCRVKTTIPEKGLSDLPNFFFLSALIDDVIDLEKLKEDIKPVLNCEGCDKGLEAISQCVDCNTKLCKLCLENHAKLDLTKQHQIVKDVGSPNMRPKEKGKNESPKCRKHADQELSYYCNTCDLLACPICVVRDHRASDHDLSEIKDSIQSYRQAIEEALQNVDGCRKQLQKINDSIKHSKHRLQLMVDRALRDIVAKEEEDVAKIRNASRLLQERVTQIGQERGEEMDRIQSSNHNKMSRAEQIAASVKSLMQHGDNFELLDLKPKVMHHLEFFKQVQFESVQHSKSFVGFKGHEVVTGADLGEILEEEKWGVKAEFGKEGEGEGEFKFSRDVACFSNGDIVVTDITNCRLSTFTSKGCCKSTGVQGSTYGYKLKKPRCVAVTPDDLLLVIDEQDVKVYDKELRYVRQFRPSQIEVEGQSESLLRGITVDTKNRIAVADCKRQVISLHNLDGSIISKIHHDDISKTYACFLSLSSKERLIFTNSENMRLVCLDLMGNEVFNIITSIDGKPVKPAGVSCDGAGDIYVCVHGEGRRGTFEVHHYNASGEQIGRVAHRLNNPSGITFTPTGDLIVADKHSVKILVNESDNDNNDIVGDNYSVDDDDHNAVDEDGNNVVDDDNDHNAADEDNNVVDDDICVVHHSFDYDDYDSYDTNFHSDDDYESFNNGAYYDNFD